jgi:hypothetical protein
VHIAFRFVRQLVVEHVGNRVDVDTARGDIRRDEHPDVSILETPQCTLASIL